MCRIWHQTRKTWNEVALLHPSAGAGIITAVLWVKLADKFCIKMFQYIEISPLHARAEAEKGHYNG